MWNKVTNQLRKVKRMSKNNPTRALILFPLIVLGLVLTISVALQPQRLVQFASEDAPPFFGCIHLGVADPTNCGTRMGAAGDVTLKLYGRPFNPDKQQVYYGDRLSGNLKYTNVGTLIFKMRSLGLGGTPAKGGDGFQMTPYKSNITLQPKEVVSVDNASHLFTNADGNGDYKIGPKIVDDSGTAIPVAEGGTKIHLNATCTALRNKELTGTDKTNLKAFCGKNPSSSLCTSKEYCQIMKGGDCAQNDTAKEEPGVQCDQYVYMPPTEQSMLEQFCKVYPDSDSCADFCARTIGSEICPKKYLFIDTVTGKPIRMNTPRAIYVRDPDSFKFTYSKDYPIGAKRYTPPSQGNVAVQAEGPKAVAGAQTGPIEGRLLADAGVQYTCQSDNDCNDPTRFSCQAHSCRLRPAAPAPLKPGTQAPPPCDTPPSLPCGAPKPVPAAAPGATVPALPGGPGSGNSSTCAGLGQPQGCKGNVGSSFGGLPGTLPQTNPDCIKDAQGVCLPQCTAGEDAVKTGCVPAGLTTGTLNTPGGAKDANGNVVGIAKGDVANGYLPCNVNVDSPLNPGTGGPRSATNPNGKLEHAPTCPTNPDGTPKDGATAKAGESPHSCNDVSGKSNETGCEYLCRDYNAQDKWAWCNKKEKPVMGQQGYNAKCGSGLQDTNNGDDPANVDQHACCARGDIPTKAGCCGSVCGVWKMDATVNGDGTVTAKNLRGKNNETCTNINPGGAADDATLVKDNACHISGANDQCDPRINKDADNNPACNVGNPLYDQNKIAHCLEHPDDQANCKDFNPSVMKDTAIACLDPNTTTDVCTSLRNGAKMALSLIPNFPADLSADAKTNIKNDLKLRSDNCVNAGVAQHTPTHLVFLNGDYTKPMCIFDVNKCLGATDNNKYQDATPTDPKTAVPPAANPSDPSCKTVDSSYGALIPYTGRNGIPNTPDYSHICSAADAQEANPACRVGDFAQASMCNDFSVDSPEWKSCCITHCASGKTCYDPDGPGDTYCRNERGFGNPTNKDIAGENGRWQAGTGNESAYADTDCKARGKYNSNDGKLDLDPNTHQCFNTNSVTDELVCIGVGGKVDSIDQCCSTRASSAKNENGVPKRTCQY